MRTQISKRTRAALTFREILIVLAVLIILALFLTAHNYRHAGAKRSARINCVNNLKQLGIAFRGFGIDLGGFPAQVPATNGGAMEAKFAYEHFLVLSNELNNPRILVCPNDDGRTSVSTFDASLSNSNLSYFVNLDGANEFPNTIIVGDRNLTVDGTPPKAGLAIIYTNNTVGWTSRQHKNQGHILTADGSVQTWTSPRLNRSLKQSGVLTNRLLFP